MPRYVALSLACLFITVDLPADEPILERGAALKVVATDGAGGEGPVWHPQLGVLCSGNGHINQTDRQGNLTLYRRDAGTNGLIFDRQGRLIACDSQGRRVVR